jgi:hypothetical protein
LPLGYPPPLFFFFLWGWTFYIGCQQSSSFQFCDVEILVIFPEKLANFLKIPNISPIFRQFFFWGGGRKSMDLLLFLSLVACRLDALVGFISSNISNNPVIEVFFFVFRELFFSIL